MTQKRMPTIVLIGRTNVGKSTLFNKLLEKPKALVSQIAGTTRDRNEGECVWRGKSIKVIDTGGLDGDETDEIEENIKKQADLAIKQADLILFLVDIREGLMPQEKELSEYISNYNKPVILVGNKAEKTTDRLSVENPEWQLPNLETPIPISGAKGTGVGDLLDKVYSILEKNGTPPIESTKINAIRISVIGKPNVGKSTLINAISGEERFITSPIAHTTREPNDTLIQFGDKNYIFVDTAGMRKKGKVKKAGGLEASAVRRNENAIRHSDVALLVLDSSEPMGTQEKVLAGLLKGSGTGVIIVANKWDLIENKTSKTINEYKTYIASSIPFLRWAPVIFVSALNKLRVTKLFEMIDEVTKNRALEISDKDLDSFLQYAIKTHLPSRGKGPKPPKVLGMIQIKTSPPEFDLVIKAKQTDVLHPSYVRYLKNKLRDNFKLEGTPIKINVRGATSVSK